MELLVSKNLIADLNEIAFKRYALNEFSQFINCSVDRVFDEGERSRLITEYFVKTKLEINDQIKFLKYAKDNFQSSRLAVSVSNFGKNQNSPSVKRTVELNKMAANQLLILISNLITSKDQLLIIKLDTAALDPNVEKHKQVALNYLETYLKSDYKGNRIVSDADYNQLYSYVSHLIEHKNIPPITKPIYTDKNTITAQNLMHVFYLIHKDIYGDTKGDLWPTFIKKALTAANGSEIKTIKSKWSTHSNSNNNYPIKLMK